LGDFPSSIGVDGTAAHRGRFNLTHKRRFIHTPSWPHIMGKGLVILYMYASRYPRITFYHTMMVCFVFAKVLLLSSHFHNRLQQMIVIKFDLSLSILDDRLPMTLPAPRTLRFGFSLTVGIDCTSMLLGQECRSGGIAAWCCCLARRQCGTRD